MVFSTGVRKNLNCLYPAKNTGIPKYSKIQTQSGNMLYNVKLAITNIKTLKVSVNFQVHCCILVCSNCDPWM